MQQISQVLLRKIYSLTECSIC